MFSTHNREWNDYLRRLYRPLHSLPPDARAEAQQELRQHLDALVAAQRERGATEEEAARAAMHLFGDPARVGRRIAGEWRFQHTQKAGRYFPFYWLTRSLVALLFVQWHLHIQNTRPFAEWGGTHSVLYNSITELAVALVSSLFIGLFAPGCAFRVAFYSWLWLSGGAYMSALAIYGHEISFFHNGHFYQHSAYSTTVLPLLAPLTVLASFAVQCGVAYLVSAYRRGTFYALRWADFRPPFWAVVRQQWARRK